jgi:threonine synthase
MPADPLPDSRLVPDPVAMARPLFNPAAVLRCAGCGLVSPLGPAWQGCDRCGGPLLVGYAAPSTMHDPREDLEAAIAELRPQVLPIDPRRRTDIGLTRTPLVGFGVSTWVKVEGQNPTGSHKDRFHAVASVVARELGYSGVVAVSTGNHGAACAGYGAASGLRAAVLLHPEAPDALRIQLRAYGADVAIVPGEVPGTLADLVALGYCPCTSADHRLVGFGNPYGQEGYKDIAFEVVVELGRVPGVVAVPVASGDTVYGIWRGFRDLHEHLGLDMPLIVGCQPEGAAPLALPGAGRVDGPRPHVAEATSMALSTRDAETGWHASYALEQDGLVHVVPEEDLARALGDLGGRGLYVEPASALAIAALRRLADAGLVARDAVAVALLTSSGLNWGSDVEGALGAVEPARTRAAMVKRVAQGPAR